MSLASYLYPAAAIGVGSIAFRPKRGFSVPPAAGAAGPPQFITAQVTLEESHADELEITEHPVEHGAAISDHAYKRPSEVTIRCAWSNSPSAPSGIASKAVGLASALLGNPAPAIAGLPSTIQAASSLLSGNGQAQVKELYATLLKLQVTPSLVDVLTGKRSYKNMLLRSLRVDTEAKTENVLMVVAVFREVLIVRTQIVSVLAEADAQKSPEKTAPSQPQGVKQLQDAPSFVPPESTILGATSAVQGAAATASNLLSQVPGGLSSLSGVVSGALGQLPDALSSVTATVGDLASQLPLPAEIPLLPSAQSLTVTLSSSLEGGLKDALAGLPAALAPAQSVISGALGQLPGVISSLPEVLSSLPDALGVLQDKLTNLTSLVPDALSRATSAVVNGGAGNALSLAWNGAAGAWVANVADSVGNAVVSGVPLVTGANLLEQFNHLGFSGQLLAQTDHALAAVPTLANLGSSGHLVFCAP